MAARQQANIVKRPGRNRPGGEEGDPTSSGQDLREILDLLKRRGWLIAVTALLAFASAWWFQRDLVPVYTAEALLQQKEEEPVLSSGSALRFPRGAFADQIEIVRSRSVAEPVVDSLGLQLTLIDPARARTDVLGIPEVAPDAPPGRYRLTFSDGQVVLADAGTGSILRTMSPESPVQGPGFRFAPLPPGALREPLELQVAERANAVERLQSSIQVQEGAAPDLLRLQYKSNDPEHAAQVVNAVAESFQGYRAEAARAESRRRRSVIADELVQLADSLRGVQEEVLAFQESQQLLDPGVESNALMTSLLETENQIRQLRFDESLLESLVVGLEDESASSESFRRIMTMGQGLVPGGPALDQQLQELENRRAELTASSFGLTANDPQVQVVDSLIASTRAQLRNAAESALRLLRQRLASAEERVAQLRGQLGALPSRTAELERRQQRVDAVQQVFDLMVDRYYEAQIAEGVEAGDVEIVDPASVPLRPDPSRKTLNLLIALVAGIAVGGLGAVVLDQLDSRVRRPADAESAAELAVLGTVPRIRSRAPDSKSVLIGKEAFRGIRTNLRFALPEHPKVLAVTSAGPGEGKSTVGVNLALTMVEQGQRVLLVDADLRRPQVHNILGLDRSPGLVDVLLGDVDPSQGILTAPLHPGLDVLPAGTPVQNHSELVGSAEFLKLMRGLRSSYDLVILDTSPVLAVTDATLVGTVADGTVLVVRANETDKGALAAAVDQLRRVNAPMVGIIFNDVSVEKVGYSSYYDSYHHPESESGRGAPREKRWVLPSATAGSRSESE